jgi:hypothetical protein
MNVALMTTDMLVQKVSSLCSSPGTSGLCWEMARHYRERIESPTEFEAGWYKSVQSGSPDFSIYDGERYVPEATACYLVYAKRYIKTASKLIDGRWPVEEVWDLGCGIGASTALLKLLFPGANVFGTQLPSAQRKIAEAFGSECGFKIEDSMQSNGNAIVFMLDYLEHFQCPTDHLKTIIEQNPRLLVMANSFGATAVGHFPKYKIGDSLFINKETGRHFSKWLKNNGYKKVETGFYNNRPAIWERAE